MTDKRFQWSKFRNGKDEQFVVRSDDWQEFQKDIQNVMDRFFDFAAEMEAAQEDPMPTDEEIASAKLEQEPKQNTLAKNTGFCSDHQVQMKTNKNGKFYHREFANGKARFCNGYGWGDWS